MRNTKALLIKLTPLWAWIFAVLWAVSGYMLYAAVLGLIVSGSSPGLSTLRTYAVFRELQVYGPAVVWALGLFWLLQYTAVKIWLRCALAFLYLLGFFFIFEL